MVIVDFEPQSSDWGIATPHGEISAAAAGLCRLEVTAAKTRLTSVRGEFAFRAREQGPESRVAAGMCRSGRHRELFHSRRILTSNRSGRCKNH